MFRMSFDFEDRNYDNQDLQVVNAALASMRLSDLKMEDSDGYLATREVYDQETNQLKETKYNYGFDRLTFACDADEDEDLHAWQVDVQTFPKGEVSSTHAFHDMWCNEHPDRAMRTLAQYSYDNADVYVVLHHEKTVVQKSGDEMD